MSSVTEHAVRRERDYRRRVRMARFGLRLVRSAGRKRRGLVDRLLTLVLRRATAPAAPAADFMRDELVDARISFDPVELARYQAGDGARGESEAS